ncbi:hypothetical protein ACL9RL_02545 [Plantibacter sp. Mn2098]|uniref:hypothetical protein n=1 Tax=Plantibacter sp. Mn2098 TaxID=3395266 RepID=UPI003BE803BB
MTANDIWVVGGYLVLLVALGLILGALLVSFAVDKQRRRAEHAEQQLRQVYSMVSQAGALGSALDEAALHAHRELIREAVAGRQRTS